MKYIKNNKTLVDFIQLFLYITTFSCVLFILNFQIFSDYFSYILCSEIVTTEMSFRDTIFEINFPVSCDLDEYIVGIENPLAITTYDHSYQFRIMYFFYLSLISKILGIFLIQGTLLYYFSTFVFGQILLVLICTHIVSKLVKFDAVRDRTTKFLIATLLVTSPLFKFGIFDPSQQTFVSLSIFLSLFLIKSDYIRKPSKVYYFSILFGLLYLVNKVFFLNLCILLILHFVYTKIDFVDYIVFYSWRLISIFLAPNILYLIYFEMNNLSPYSAVSEKWGHFVWIKYYLMGGEKHRGEWYCHNIPDNFVCYFNDTLQTIEYIFIPILLILYLGIRNGYISLNQLSLKHLKISKYEDFNLANSIVVIFILSFSFWSLIGWYPPVRFNLYTIGPLFTFLFIIIMSKMKYLIIEVTLFYVIYFLQLPHWSNQTVGVFNIVFICSIILFIYIILRNEMYMKKKNEHYRKKSNLY
jgi:hypothetical protein